MNQLLYNAKTYVKMVASSTDFSNSSLTARGWLVTTRVLVVMVIIFLFHSCIEDIPVIYNAPDDTLVIRLYRTFVVFLYTKTVC